jgi:hypothetical protein
MSAVGRRPSAVPQAEFLSKQAGKYSFDNLQFHFQARSQNCEKRLLRSSCLSVRTEVGFLSAHFH